MDQAFFMNINKGIGEGDTSIMSSRKEDGKGFLLASHPPFSLSKNIYGNSDRIFPTNSFNNLPVEYGSFSLSDYKLTHGGGCSSFLPHITPHCAAFSHLSLKHHSSYLYLSNLLQNCDCDTKKKGMVLSHILGLSYLNLPYV